MHFVTEKENMTGAHFSFSQSVPILPDEQPSHLAKRVNEAEHKWQPIVTQKSSPVKLAGTAKIQIPSKVKSLVDLIIFYFCGE